MKTAIVAVTTLFGLAPAPANAQGDEPAGRFFLTPHLGVTSESDFVEGAVRFSDGDVDFISIEPGTGLLLGLELGYAFGPINYVQLKHAAPMKQKIPDSSIVIERNGKAPFDFLLSCSIADKQSQSEAQLFFDADLNPMFKMMASKPLTNFLNLIASKLKEI